MITQPSRTVALIVAHPDDETLWAGGTMLLNPKWKWFVVCLCRGNDKERAPRYFKALKILKAEGTMGDLDDGPDQNPLKEEKVENTILKLLPHTLFDLVITHNPTGEYTKNLRHEEASKAVINLWHSGKLQTKELWTFAYEDGNKEYYPKPFEKATLHYPLSEEIWKKKYELITQTYGFKKEGWEAHTTPHAEAFWQFNNPNEAMRWLENGGVLAENK